GGALSNMPLHMADVGTDNYEQEFTLSLMANQGQALEEIGAALERLEDGSFGRCEECAGEIPAARLEALPYARYCVECARKMEQNSYDSQDGTILSLAALDPRPRRFGPRPGNQLRRVLVAA